MERLRILNLQEFGVYLSSTDANVTIAIERLLVYEI